MLHYRTNRFPVCLFTGQTNFERRFPVGTRPRSRKAGKRFFSTPLTPLLYVKACNYAGEKLKLALKPKIAGKTADGAPFLGFLVKPNGIHLQQKTKRRYKARFAGIEYERKQGAMSEADAGRRMESVTAHLLIARSRNFRNNILS